jgi:predicted Zn-dependent peptidase
MEMKKHVYPNGLTVVYEQSKFPICALYAYVRVGSINENAQNRGSSHFIEHMCFKGTKKIQTAKKLFTSYNKIGAVFNAFTEKDHTCFYVQCGDEYIQTCLNILSDTILNSVFDKDEFKMETPVMMEEMIREEDDPNTKLMTEMDRYLYAGSPYSEPIDDIEYHNKKTPYDYKETVDYYRKYYKPENIVVSIVSSLSFAKIKDVLSKTFFLQNKKSPIKVPTELLSYHVKPTDKPEYKILEKPGMKSHHLCIAFKTCAHSNIDRFSLNLLSQIVGGGLGSRMSILLREHNGLTYESSCSTEYLRIGGEFMIYAVLDPSKLFRNGNKKGVLPLILELIRELISKGITAEELAVSKGNYKGKLLLQQEKAHNKAEYNGIQAAIYGEEEFTPYDKMYDKYYDGLTVKDLNRVIRTYLKASNMYVSIIGERGSHFPTLEKIEKVCNIK